MHRLIFPLIAALLSALLLTAAAPAPDSGNAQASGNVTVRLYDPDSSSEDSSGGQIGSTSRPDGSGGHRFSSQSLSEPEIFILKDDEDQALGPLPQTGAQQSLASRLIIAGSLCLSAGLIVRRATGEQK